MLNSRTWIFGLLATQLIACGAVKVPDLRPSEGEPVVLLHGLARSAASMNRMETSLRAAGYDVCNVDYPSRHHPIAELASDYVMPSITQCFPGNTRPIHFVTHSLGGIIVRELSGKAGAPNIGRVVMLGPPNHGSEVVDALGDWRLFQMINGPAGQELGTDTNSIPQQLGPAPFQVGIIAGEWSINWINSLIIPGSDDGKVSIQSAKLDGMQDFATVRTTHPFIMKNTNVIELTLRFLSTGCFAHHGGECANAAEQHAATDTPTLQRRCTDTAACAH